MTPIPATPKTSFLPEDKNQIQQSYWSGRGHAYSPGGVSEQHEQIQTFLDRRTQWLLSHTLITNCWTMSCYNQPCIHTPLHLGTKIRRPDAQQNHWNQCFAQWWVSFSKLKKKCIESLEQQWFEQQKHGWTRAHVYFYILMLPSRNKWFLQTLKKKKKYQGKKHSPPLVNYVSILLLP